MKRRDVAGLMRGTAPFFTLLASRHSATPSPRSVCSGVSLSKRGSARTCASHVRTLFSCSVDALIPQTTQVRRCERTVAKEKERERKKKKRQSIRQGKKNEGKR